MFGKNQEEQSSPSQSIDEIKRIHRNEMDQKNINHKNEIDKLTNTQELDLKTLIQDHELALKEKEFELKHAADERVKTAEDKTTALHQDLAVAKKENEMLGKIVDLSSDIIDVKDLVKNLIEKLPEVKLSSLTVESKE